MKISIIGCGWFGYDLALELLPQHDIRGTTRSAEKAKDLRVSGIGCTLLDFPEVPDENLLNSDFVILNIPPFEGQLTWFKSWPWPGNSHLIFISSTSVYGTHQGEVDETTLAIPDTQSGKILLSQENWVKEQFKHSIIRFGGLVGKERHPGKVLSGRTDISGGNQPINLLHQADAIGFTKLIIENKTEGLFNLVSDFHPSRKEFYQTYCRDKGLPLPHFLDSDDCGKMVNSCRTPEFYQFIKRELT